MYLTSLAEEMVFSSSLASGSIIVRLLRKRHIQKLWNIRFLQKWREPTILENNRLGFIESVHEN